MNRSIYKAFLTIGLLIALRSAGPPRQIQFGLKLTF